MWTGCVAKIRKRLSTSTESCCKLCEPEMRLRFWPRSRSTSATGHGDLWDDHLAKRRGPGSRRRRRGRSLGESVRSHRLAAQNRAPGTDRRRTSCHSWRWRGARRTRPRVPYRYRLRLRRGCGPGLRYRALRDRWPITRLAFGRRLRWALVLRAGGTGLPSYLGRRLTHHRRARTHALHGRGHRRAIPLPREGDRDLRTAWAGLEPPGAPRRIRRALA